MPVLSMLFKISIEFEINKKNSLLPIIMEKMIIEKIAIKKIINISMSLLFINKIKIKGIYPAIINIPLSKLQTKDKHDNEPAIIK